MKYIISTLILLLALFIVALLIHESTSAEFKITYSIVETFEDGRDVPVQKYLPASVVYRLTLLTGFKEDDFMVNDWMPLSSYVVTHLGNFRVDGVNVNRERALNLLSRVFDSGIDPNLKGAKRGMTVLHAALFSYDSELVVSIIDHGGSVYARIDNPGSEIDNMNAIELAYWLSGKNREFPLKKMEEALNNL